MSREELIELAKKIVAVEGTEKEMHEMYDLFSRNVPHPNGANLFFYPENYNARRDKLEEYNPTIEEVVDKCLAYKPIIL